MACAAAGAIKAQRPGELVWIWTTETYAVLPAACPHVDQVFTSDAALKGALRSVIGPACPLHYHDLSPVRFGLSPEPQVKAFLRELGLDASARTLSLDLEIPEEAETRVADLTGPRRGRRILLHAAQGDPNRTWPQDCWEALARRFLQGGHEVFLVGDRRGDPYKGAMALRTPGLRSLIDQLDLLEFAALCRVSDLLVTTDSGPVQLAGASDIGILGIYSVVQGIHRLPFRHGIPAWNAVAVEPRCALKGCYQYMGMNRHIQRHREAFERGGAAVNDVFAKWCLADDPYACLRSQITAEEVHASAATLLSMPAGERGDLANRIGAALDAGRSDDAGILLTATPADDSGFAMARATLLMAQGRTGEALSILSDLVTRNPGWTEALEALMVCGLMEGQWMESVKCIRALAVMDPSNPLVAGARNYLKAWQEMNQGASEACLQTLAPHLGGAGIQGRAFGIRPEHLEVLAGFAALGLDDSGRASRHFTRAVEAAPRTADAWFGLGEVADREGRQEEASRLFWRALEVDPDHPWARQRVGGRQVVPAPGEGE